MNDEIQKIIGVIVVILAVVVAAAIINTIPESLLSTQVKSMLRLALILAMPSGLGIIYLLFKSR